ncbi:MAG: Gfo/Idh/MocA family oxidoreductase [Clostridia bacterium]|nr:Gfo/Idh/MocA family oxidoreductase [Clostridia bacterium]
MKSGKTVKIGFVGVGAISGIYLENITKKFDNIDVIGVCDLIRERAENAVNRYGIPKLYNDMYELFADPEVDIVLNITRPDEHYEVTKAALEAGKHVYSEKPLAATLEQGRELVGIAKKKGLLLGGAPDTYLGAGIQTCRKLLEEGLIGDIVGAAGWMLCPGHESWHPDPEFYYKRGGGPMFDMGPYYITCLVNLAGNVSAVSAMTKKTFKTRTITSAPHRGEVIEVDVPTFYAGTMRFESGAIGTIITTFDVYNSANNNCLEIYGTKGTLYVPDPNMFDGPVRVMLAGEAKKDIDLAFRYRENSRGLGLADMAKALSDGSGKFRANCDQTLHVLEIMEGFAVSGNEHREIEISSRFERTPIMDTGL